MQSRPSLKHRLFCAIPFVATALCLRFCGSVYADTTDSNAVALRNRIKVSLFSNGVPGTTIDAKAITIEVAPLPGGHYAVILGGPLPNPAAGKALQTFVQKLNLPNVYKSDIVVETALPDTPAAAPSAPKGEEQIKNRINFYFSSLSSAVTPITFSALTLSSAPKTNNITGLNTNYIAVKGVFEDPKDLAAAHSFITRLNKSVRPNGWAIVDQLQGFANTVAYKKLETQIDNVVHTPNSPAGIRAHILPLAGDKYAIHLYASNPIAPSRITSVISAIKQIDPNLTIVNDISPEEPIVRVSKLHFLRAALPDGIGKNLNAANPDINGIGTDQAAVGLAKQLGLIYPGGPTITPQENALILSGDPHQVRHIRNIMALYLDVPSPLVRADVLTIQINSKDIRTRQRAVVKVNEILAGVQVVRDLVHGSLLTMGGYVAGQKKSIDKTLATSIDGKVLSDQLVESGFDPNPERPLSLNEMLIFMALMNRDKLRSDLQTSPNIPGGRGALTQKLLASLNDLRLLEQKEHPSLVRLIDKIIARIDTGGQHNQYLLDRVGKLYISETQDADVAAMSHFLSSWSACSKAVDSNQPVPDEDALPGILADASSHTDEDLKTAMEAVSADLKNLYFDPLLEWIREDVQQGSEANSGIDIIGETRLLVRDRTLAESAGTAQSYFKFTPIPKLTLDNLKNAQTLANGTGTQTTQRVATDKAGKVIKDSKGNPVVLNSGQSVATDPTTGEVLLSDGNPLILSNAAATNPLTALGTLNPMEALGLTALLQAEPDPVYRSIAPGTSLALRPFVAPDGGAARIQINLVNAVATDASSTAQQGGPMDSITSHSVVTEANISAFDLVEIASFGAQTTALGDYRWRIPLLDQIPVIGDLFHGPRGRETHRQESIAIVNLTILPRSLDLIPGRYPRH